MKRPGDTWISCFACMGSRPAVELRPAGSATIPHTPEPLVLHRQPKNHGRQEHLAHWINLYNASPIRPCVKAYPIASIRPDAAGPPNDRLLAFFHGKRHKGLRSNGFSLAWIEQDVASAGDLRHSSSPSSAPLGCPFAAQEAYRPELGGKQLDDD